MANGRMFDISAGNRKYSLLREHLVQILNHFYASTSKVGVAAFQTSVRIFADLSTDLRRLGVQHSSYLPGDQTLMSPYQEKKSCTLTPSNCRCPNTRPHHLFQVAVCDYIWENHGVKSRISSCDLQQQNKISVSALGPGDVTSHVSICTVYPSGFQELYRHFLRLPSGAIVEVFGDISGLRFIPTEMVMAIQEQMSELDSIPEDSFDIKSREMKRIH
eukprot:XP_022270148.1 uncharacterized protein LOC111093986 [Canis lupus familiaris]